MSEATGGALGSAWNSLGILGVCLSLRAGDIPFYFVETPNSPGKGTLRFDLPAALRGQGHWESGFSRGQRGGSPGCPLPRCCLLDSYPPQWFPPSCESLRSRVEMDKEVRASLDTAVRVQPALQDFQMAPHLTPSHRALTLLLPLAP